MSKVNGKNILRVSDLDAIWNSLGLHNHCGMAGKRMAGAGAKGAVREVSTKEESGKVAMDQAYYISHLVDPNTKDDPVSCKGSMDNAPMYYNYPTAAGVIPMAFCEHCNRIIEVDFN